MIKKLACLMFVFVFCFVSGCAFHAETSMGAGKGCDDATNMSARKPAGLYGNCPKISTITTGSSEFRSARD